MNIRDRLEKAEEQLEKGLRLIKSVKSDLCICEELLETMDPNGVSKMPICCTVTTRKGITYCLKLVNISTEEERIRLCRECRVWCRAKIKELKERIRKER